MSTNDPMTQERLDAIQRRVSDATPGPWLVETCGHLITHVNDADGIPIGICQECTNDATYEAPNADLIANAPQDLADLLAEVDRLRTLTTVTDDMVERGVRAFCEHPTPGVDASLRPNWDRLAKASPDVADSYRRHMTVALNAALNPRKGS